MRLKVAMQPVRNITTQYAMVYGRRTALHMNRAAYGWLASARATAYNRASVHWIPDPMSVRPALSPIRTLPYGIVERIRRAASGWVRIMYHSLLRASVDTAAGSYGAAASMSTHLDKQLRLLPYHGGTTGPGQWLQEDVTAVDPFARA